ncbi:conserved Plasmodium protein, unknown function [Plasmodium reichenowi]|uniref:Uncharacterized protein n=1 Tax=Plasmodium reichenowi TaxID=5854 RepID=A0A2P9DF98_PLARE|nr:conserved Plasmodium protein, unknown function [Plasmodium reichenowi]
MKVQNNIIKEDPFSVSHIIGDRLLQGWTLLNATCHMCNITPLIKQKNKEDRYCARCDLFIKIRETSHEKEEKINDILNEEIIKDEKKDNDKDLLNEKENVSSLNNDSLMYIKEIKLQNEEFNNILNKNNICTKDLVGDLLEYKNYIKDRCGYNVAEWLNMQTVKTNQANQTNETNQANDKKDVIMNDKMDVIMNGKKDVIMNDKKHVIMNDKKDVIMNDKKEEDILNYIKNKTNEQMNTYKHTNNLDEDYIYNIHSKDLHRTYFKNMYQNNQNEKHEDNYINVLQHVRRDLKISEQNYFCPSKLHSNKYNKLETEFFILNKTKNVLMDKLEKYTDKLSKNDNTNEELENISHLVTIVTILEKINNLKKYVMV